MWPCGRGEEPPVGAALGFWFRAIHSRLCSAPGALRVLRSNRWFVLLAWWRPHSPPWLGFFPTLTDTPDTSELSLSPMGPLAMRHSLQSLRRCPHINEDFGASGHNTELPLVLPDAQRKWHDQSKGRLKVRGAQEAILSSLPSALYGEAAPPPRPCHVAVRGSQLGLLMAKRQSKPLPKQRWWAPVLHSVGFCFLLGRTEIFQHCTLLP